jgi:hypothetical protein
MNLFTQQGWQCPLCQRVYSPTTPTCFTCPPKVVTTSTPPKREPLSDEEIAEIAATPAAIPGSYVHSFARAIEAAHGIGEMK